MVDFSAFLKDPSARENADRALQLDYRNNRLKKKLDFSSLRDALTPMGKVTNYLSNLFFLNKIKLRVKYLKFLIFDKMLHVALLTSLRSAVLSEIKKDNFWTLYPQGLNDLIAPKTCKTRF